MNAQLSTGTITGVVRDASGGVLANATVILKNVDTNVERKIATNSAGNYLFLNITPGLYTLETNAPGFRPNKVSPFELQVNQTLTQDTSLEIGTLEQAVQVEATAETLQSSTAELGAVIEQKAVNDLPLNGRNFTALLQLTPGAAPISVSQNSGAGTFGTPTTYGADYEFPAINGQTNRSNFFRTDGLNNQGSFLSTYAVPPIVDTIQEFKVNSHNDQAEFGSVLGGVINVVTKSGTNALHGTAWEYVRNNAFDARSTFQDSVQIFHQNEFGFTVGGPVVLPKLYNGRNRTFFYGGLQEFRYRSPANSFFRVPTAANYGGDLSNLLPQNQIYNPFSTREDPNRPGVFLRDPFPNNQIPGSLIDKNVVAFAQAILPNAGPLVNGHNAIDTTPLHQNVQDYTFRVDQNFGQKDYVWFRWSAAQQDTTQSGGLPSLSSIIERPGLNYGTSWVHTFSSTLVLQAQFGHSNVQDNGAQRFVTKVPDIGFSPTFAGSFIGGATIVPALNVDGYFGGGENNGTNPKFGNIYEYRGNISKVLGKHNMKWGGEWASNTFESLYNNANSNYSAQTTGLNTPELTAAGSSLASFLLNTPDNAGRRNVHETTRLGGVMSFYFQDSWKVTPKLTVNAGLRYDRTFQPPYGLPDTVGQNGGIETGAINFNNGTYVVQKLPPSCKERGFAPCIPGDGSLPAGVVVDPRGKVYHDTTSNWGPRFGFAYKLGSKTAIRSSFGIFYDNWASVSQSAQNYEGAWPDIGQQLANNLNKPTSATPRPTVRGQDPFAPSGAAPIGARCYCSAESGLFPALTPFNQVQWFMDPYEKNPYSMQWNFGIQHQITPATVVTVNYVGSGSRRLNVGGYYNVALTPGPGDPQKRALYPNIGPTFYDRSIGKGSYNSLQFQYERRYSQGWTYQVSYTYSKSIDIGSSGWYGVEGQSVTDPYHINRDRGPSGFDLTQQIAFNTLYDIPFGTGKRFSSGNKVVDYALGNWQVNSIFTARSGQVYNVYVSGDVANTGNVGWTQYERANLVGDPNAITNRTRDHYINTAAFAIPQAFTFGALGRNRFRSDPYWNLDFSLFRSFPIKEKIHAEIRAEGFNVMNTVIYGTPNNDMADPANFGRITSLANKPRQLQLGAKFVF